MKFLEKLKKFKNDLENSQKYQVFMMKKDAHQSKTWKFFLEKLKLKYPLAFWFYTKHYFKEFGIWVLDIIMNGTLIYISFTGIISPINIIHRIVAFGLGIYIPTKIITIAYNRISLEKKIQAHPAMYAPRIRT